MDIQKIVVGALQTNCYILSDSGEAIIIDPGDDAREIAEIVKNTGAACKLIINTHCHFDHTGANAALKKGFNSPILIGNGAKEYLDFVPDSFVKDGDLVSVGTISLRIIETPGHTKDGICLFGPSFVFSGDALFKDGIGRTDLFGGSDREMALSLKKLDELIPENAIVYPGHGETFNYSKGMSLQYLDYLG